MESLIRQLCHGDLWLPWLPLQRERRETGLPNGEGGLYRICMQGTDACVYIGETGNYQRRLDNELGRSLRAKTMPDGEHHTAAPGLWYLNQAYEDCPLQVSLAPLPDVPPVRRKGLESLAIALERWLYRRSPMLNYGRMPDGLVKPRRAKARNAPETDDESIAPVGDLFDMQQVHSLYWGGHQWSDWTPVTKLRHERAQGLYRLRSDRGTDLVLIGQGTVAHATSFDTTLDCSYASGAWTKTQRRELLEDLIAQHLLSHGRLPSAQFGGNTTDRPEQRERFIQYLQRMEEVLIPDLWFPQITTRLAS